MAQIEVGIKFKGQSNCKSTANVRLIRCVTYQALERYTIKLLENCPKEDVDKVKALTGKVYSIGATPSEIQMVTLYIKSVDEIVSEEQALENEKQRSIEAIKETTAEKVKLEQENVQKEENIKILNEDLAKATQKKEEYKEKCEKLESDLRETQLKLGAESELRQRVEKELEEYKSQLGNTIIDNKLAIKENNAKLEAEHKNEIARIQDIITGKDEEIKKRDETIEDLNYRIKELSKSGAIPEITYEYGGKAKIISVVSHGSYGVSNLVYSLYKILAEKGDKNILVVDLDFKGGNLNQYMKRECYTIENMLKGGDCFKESIMKSMGGQFVDYAGGVEHDWQPVDIIGLDFKSIFEGKAYDYIICDGSQYGGYNIQTIIGNMLMRIGKVVNIYTREDRIIEGAVNIKNYDNKQGLPFISKVSSEKLAFYDEPICKAKILTNIIPEII